MELIALKDFRNVNNLRLKEEDKEGKRVSTVEGAPHDDHIHKGARINIGSGKTLKDIQKSDPATAQVIASLVVSGCVGDASDKEVVKAVEEDLAIDKKRAANAAKLNEAAGDSALVKQLISQLKGAGATPAKTGS